MDNNPAENAIRLNVIGCKNWLFSVSEAGAKANAICLSLAETAKINGNDFFQYLVKLLNGLPNIPIQQKPEFFTRLHALVKKYPSHMFKIASYLKKTQIAGHSLCIPGKCAYFCIPGLQIHISVKGISSLI